MAQELDDGVVNKGQLLFLRDVSASHHPFRLFGMADHDSGIQNTYLVFGVSPCAYEIQLDIVVQALFPVDVRVSRCILTNH